MVTGSKVLNNVPATLVSSFLKAWISIKKLETNLIEKHENPLSDNHYKCVPNTHNDHFCINGIWNATTLICDCFPGFVLSSEEHICTPGVATTTTPLVTVINDRCNLVCANGHCHKSNGIDQCVCAVSVSYFMSQILIYVFSYILLRVAGTDTSAISRLAMVMVQ